MPISKKLTVAEREILRDDYIMSVVTKYNKQLMDLITALKDTKPTDDTQAIIDNLKKKHKLDASLNRGYSYTDEIKQLDSISIKNHKQRIFFKHDIKDNTYNVTLSQNDEEDITQINNTILEYKGKRKIMETAIKDLLVSTSAEYDQQKKITSLQKELIIKCTL